MFFNNDLLIKTDERNETGGGRSDESEGNASRNEDGESGVDSKDDYESGVENRDADESLKENKDEESNGKENSDSDNGEEGENEENFVTKVDNLIGQESDDEKLNNESEVDEFTKRKREQSYEEETVLTPKKKSKQIESSYVTKLKFLWYD